MKPFFASLKGASALRLQSIILAKPDKQGTSDANGLGQDMGETLARPNPFWSTPCLSALR